MDEPSGGRRFRSTRIVAATRRTKARGVSPSEWLTEGPAPGFTPRLPASAGLFRREERHSAPSEAAPGVVAAVRWRDHRDEGG